MYVPYNAYRATSDKVAFDDLLHPHHPNPDYLRYELHRVWIVEATLKEGKKHIYARRTFYVDEDSWQILVSDNYDKDGALWRVGEAHPINYYEKPVFMAAFDLSFDLKNGRYLATGLPNEYPVRDFEPDLRKRDFTPQVLRREGR